MGREVRHKHKLEKVLGFKVILLITINAIMGTGIFFLPAVGVMQAGPASIISWVILSIVSIYIAMCFGELTSMFPKSGGVYEFSKQAYGRFWSFIIGWITLVAGNITIAMLIVGAIHYLLPVPLPYVKIPVSLLFIFIFNFIAYRGMKVSATMLISFGIITLGTLFLLIIPGLFRINPDNFTPFFPYTIPAIFIAIFFIAETFFGWETATFLAAETKNGRKVMPKVLIYATSIIAVISLLFIITSIGSIPWQAFGESTTPLTDLGKLHYGSLGRDIFVILVYLSIIGSVAGWIVSAPRLILAMAEDKLFLSQYARIHPKYKTPYKAILFQTVVTSILVVIGAGSYTTLLHLLVPLVLVMYPAVLLSLVILRFRKPGIKRYYKVPFGKIGPLIVIAMMLALLAMWVKETPGAWHIIQIGASLLFFGLPLYALLEMYYNPKTIVRVNDFLAYIALLTERLFFPKSEKREIIRLLGNVRGKNILEYGCSIGTFTLDLAEHVLPDGKVFATDESRHAIKILQKRINKRGHRHVRILLDKPNRIHPKVPNLEAVVSIGMIGYLQKEEKVLKQINQRLSIRDRLVFVDYDKFFDVIPNIEWLSDDRRIKTLFANAGFKVNVVRKWAWFWQNIYIYGHKVRDVKV